LGGGTSDNEGMTMDGRRAFVCLAALIVPLVGGATRAGASDWHVGNERRAALFGDSLADEASTEFAFLAHLAGYAVEPHVFGGTAPCDWFGDLAGLASRPPAERPTLAVIEFSGNAYTPCMQPGPAMPSESDILGAYSRDGTTFITTLLAAGIRPVFALAPAVDHQSLIPEVNALWRSLASQYPGVAVVDAGVLVDASDGTFTRTLPCGSWEGTAAGCDAGVVVVRAPDGTHFCPTETLTVDGVVGQCPVASPGAVRYAMGLSEAFAAAPVVPLVAPPGDGAAGPPDPTGPPTSPPAP
jgi:hypothetical protein